MSRGCIWNSIIRPDEASAALEHIASALLKPDGILIVTFFMGCGATYEDPMNVGHKRYFVHYTEAMCRRMLAKHFEIIAMKEHFFRSIREDARLFLLPSLVSHIPFCV
ncbi:MAG: hypothetical protein QG632_412 [Candidatus Dependentiae bacterium]|nr:hypothetical protein [Candidatus Dependentiae bacterium]